LQIIFAILFVFFVVTAVFPDVLFGVMILTLGLAFPLLYLNTVFLYFLAACQR
jgi:hypothetical protein